MRRRLRLAKWFKVFLFLSAGTFVWRLWKRRQECSVLTSKTPINLMDFVNDPELMKRAIEELHEDLSIHPGGLFDPAQCVAIIVPYRDREKNLRLFVPYMHNFLQRQNLKYKIYIVSQSFHDNLLFNRGQLINVGFQMAMEENDWDCVIYHDVDLLPQNNKNIYSCFQNQVRHMNVASSKFLYGLPYPEYMGGVGALTPAQYRLVNGYSNEYFGWGGEDDDLSQRIEASALTIGRSSPKIGRYFALKHEEQQENIDRYDQIDNFSMDKYPVEGLNSLSYTLLSVYKEPYFTNISVRIHSRRKENPPEEVEVQQHKNNL